MNNSELDFTFEPYYTILLKMSTTGHYEVNYSLSKQKTRSVERVDFPITLLLFLRGT